ncbi:MAG: hypothetical protein IJG99_05825 [Ruminococcus sp.]|nr:hypothetical protein [Ruminococcus sp.]
MTIKEFLISRVQLFFLLTTLILAASAVIGAVIAPEEELHYYQLFGPMAFAGLCVLPTCVSFFRKEPTLGQFIFRKAIELILIECIILFIISPPDDGSIPALLFYVILGAVVLVIYILALLIMWLQKYRQSKKLTDQLKNLQTSE